MAKLPKKKRLREICDQLWSLAVKIDWGCGCAMCKKREDLNSHHLIPRQHYALRYDLQNGICLCAGCHRFNPHHSPHKNGPGFNRWLETRYPLRHKWLQDTVDAGYVFTGTKNNQYFLSTMQALSEYIDPYEFQNIVGIRLCAYLEENL